MRKMFLGLALAAACASASLAQEPRLLVNGPASAGQGALERAAAAKKFAFVFFYRDKNPQTDKVWTVLQPAVAKMADWAEVAAVQVTDPAEQGLVARYDVSRAPMPLVLAIAPCGAVTKAFTGEFNESQLRTAFVSPGAQLCLKALQDRKLVLLCVLDRKGPYEALNAPQGVQEFKADGRFGPTSEVVLVNATDEGETGFLKELQVDPRTPKPLTILLAPPGSVVGKFDGRATKEQMAAQLAAAQSNPCAGGKCGPNGCGPRK